jgi:hypothetical protein
MKTLLQEGKAYFVLLPAVSHIPQFGDAASLAGDAVSPAGDLLASPNFGICGTTHFSITVPASKQKSTY